MVARKSAQAWEFGDFQTPRELAVESLQVLKEHLNFYPGTVIEPTCGVGGFLLAAVEAFPNADRFIGLELENEYVNFVRQQIENEVQVDKVEVIQANFFEYNWDLLLSQVASPILVIGNPPWVTNSDIGVLSGKNLPEKSNIHNRNGFSAINGSSNFDISEWMLLQQLDWIETHGGCIAMLCKTSVARKVLLHAWKRKKMAINCQMVQIDALRHFNASVDACFFVVQTSEKSSSYCCKFFPSFDSLSPSETLGYFDGVVLSNESEFHKLRHLVGSDTNYVWRSGIKHDCREVMELKVDESIPNGRKTSSVDLEDNFLYPILKSSDLANGRLGQARFNVIVTQRYVGENTEQIRTIAPKTWRYLVSNSQLLEQWASRIYRNKPRFSVFGVGPYSFSEWKVAISGFYKKLEFQVIGPINGKPVMLDDTSYFIGCKSKNEAEFLTELLCSKEAKSLLTSMIFWTDKRPITADLLKRLHIGKLATHLGRNREYEHFVQQRTI